MYLFVFSYWPNFTPTIHLYNICSILQLKRVYYIIQTVFVCVCVFVGMCVRARGKCIYSFYNGMR